MTAGQMQERFSFEKRSQGDDGYGTTVNGWLWQFEEYAELEMRVGGETIQAARLAGQQPASLFVWASARTRTIQVEWRAVNARTNEVWNIRSIIEKSLKRPGQIELFVQRGVAIG